MITIQTEIDEKSQKSLTKISKIVYLTLMIIGAIGLLLYLALGTIYENPYLDVLLLFAIPFGFGLVFYITINKNIKKMTENKFTNEYTFNNDFMNIASVKNGEIVGTQKLYYKDIVKVKENDEYIFIYPNKFNAFILKKSNASEEELTTIKKLLNLSK